MDLVFSIAIEYASSNEIRDLNGLISTSPLWSIVPQIGLSLINISYISYPRSKNYIDILFLKNDNGGNNCLIEAK
jgi:hypothetical protein